MFHFPELDRSSGSGRVRQSKVEKKKCPGDFSRSCNRRANRWEKSLFTAVFVLVFWMLACFWSNTPGRAITANKKHVHSVNCFFYNKKQYLGVSGSGDFFEVFDVSRLQENEFLSKFYYFCVWFSFLWNYYLFCEAHTFTKSRFEYFVLKLFFFLLTFRAGQASKARRHGQLPLQDSKRATFCSRIFKIGVGLLFYGSLPGVVFYETPQNLIQP